MKKSLIVAFLIVLMPALQCAAQSLITGKVVDAAGKKPLGDVNVEIADLQTGTLTNPDGIFSISIDSGNFILRFSKLGYLSREVAATVKQGKNLDMGVVALRQDVIALDEVKIISSVAQERKNPVALSSVSATKIEEQLGDQPYPEILKMAPGVYSARTGGGSGDAEVSIRGFGQENVALLLNGIPISGVENGLVYWNNWIGLSDVTRTIQVQRGLGASNVALNSVGGTINIVTKTTEVSKGGSLSMSVTDYGNRKIALNLSTGLLKNGMSVNFLGSRTAGPGYVDATYVDAWSYFVSLSKQFNARHTLVFTAMGAPERHGQRTLKLSGEEIDLHGIKFNKDWGSYNGKINNASENFYHKPYLTLNHYWNISDKVFLASSAYYSPGWGGGKWSETYGYATPSIFEYRNPSGQIDWDAIYNNNFNHTDTATLSNGQQVTGFSKNIQTDFLADHWWAGLLSRLEYQHKEHLKCTAGLHARYFKSRLQEKVRDLLGGDFYIDDYAWAADGVAGRNEIKTVGDIIKLDNRAIVPELNLFGQLEWDYGNWFVFLSGSLNNTWYQREDYYNYVDDTKSEMVHRTGYDIKGGANFNISEHHNVYCNAGYFSMVPYFKYVFGNYTNIPVRNLSNEKVTSVEAGYAFTRKNATAKINFYATWWRDKNFLSNEYIQLEDEAQTRAMVTGLSAFHQGVEAEAGYRLTKDFYLGGLFAVGDWKWKNNVQATLFDDNNVPVDTVAVYADGLYVGGAPQLQAGLTAKLTLLNTFQLTGNWLIYGKNFAGFDPTGRTDPGDNTQPYQIPSYNFLDLHLVYPFLFMHHEARFGLSCYNVMNETYIIRGEDGSNHDAATFSGFWGFGRTFNFDLKISF